MFLRGPAACLAVASPRDILTPYRACINESVLKLRIGGHELLAKIRSILHIPIKSDMHGHRRRQMRKVNGF